MDYFREALEGLKQTAQSLIDAHNALADVNRAMVGANEGIKRAASAALEAKTEHEDLRETVHRLEVLVLQQGQEIRALREALGH